VRCDTIIYYSTLFEVCSVITIRRALCFNSHGETRDSLIELQQTAFDNGNLRTSDVMSALCSYEVPPD
jgi:hypothetical protein